MDSKSVWGTTMKVLNEIEVGTEFSAQDLRKWVSKKHFWEARELKRPYHATVLRYLRYANTQGMKFVCTSRARSMYKRVA